MQIAKATSITEEYAQDLGEIAGLCRDAVKVVVLGPHANGLALSGEVLHLGVTGLMDDSL